jgi:hypothetical protein
MKCPQCDRLGVFGYRDSAGDMIFYCADHRLAQHWADARCDIQTNTATPFQGDRPTTPSEPAPEPFIHPCEMCGDHAYFGFNVCLREGKRGQWFCAAHRPTSDNWQAANLGLLSRIPKAGS